MIVRIGAPFPRDEILPGINNVQQNRVTSILSIVPAWKPLIRWLENLRLMSRILEVASYFRRLSSENAVISAVGETSTITIETFIAKSDDISYCLQDNCNNIWWHEWCKIKQQTQCTANKKVFYPFRIIWIDTLRWILGCHSSCSILALICIRHRTMWHKYTFFFQTDGGQYWSPFPAMSGCCYQYGT
jgi:hypothetical protein